MSDAISSGYYVSQGNAGLVFRAPTEATVPLYRGFNPNEVEHYYTTSQKDMGTAIASEVYLTEGTAAYVYPEQICGSIPLYYVWLPGKDSFYTTNETEREDALKNGYEDQGVACYVLPNL